ncbi:MAG: PilZ domain-containing protein [Bryobacteraceae bacterium]
MENHVKVTGSERRLRRRYRLELELSFHYSDRQGEPRVGRGRTADISHSGILFQTDKPPPVGSVAELHITWPFLLQDVCGLEFVAQGEILRSDDRGTALLLGAYEFRTCGERSFSPVVETRTGCEILA